MNKQPLYNWEVRVSRNKCSLVSFRLGINNKIGIRTLKFASSWEVRALTFEIVSPDLGLWERQGRDGWTYKMQGFDNVFRGWVCVGWELNKEINRKNREMRMVALCLYNPCVFRAFFWFLFSIQSILCCWFGILCIAQLVTCNDLARNRARADDLCASLQDQPTWDNAPASRSSNNLCSGLGAGTLQS